MIRSLRVRHRRMVIALAVVLPLAFAASLLVRPGRATSRLPADLIPSELECTIPLPDDAWGELPLHTLIGKPIEMPIAGAVAPATPHVGLRAVAPLRLPDLLLYWHPSEGAESLDEAVLLGSFHGKLTAALPEEARRGGGSLLLYSLAHGALAGRSTLPPLPEELPCP